MVTPPVMSPQPMSLHWPSTLRLSVILWPTSVHTGHWRLILAKSALTADTVPPVDSDPMLTLRNSAFLSFCTLAPFLSVPGATVPSRRRSNKNDISK